jgi:hypothetical protein
MKRVMHFAVVGVLAVPAFAIGQGVDVHQLIGEVRAALGGDRRLAEVTSLVATGRTTRVSGDQSMPPADVEVTMQLPDKYVRRDVVAVTGSQQMASTMGFNGHELIQAVDTPPALGGGHMMIRMGPGGLGTPGQTPEQEAEARAASLTAARRDFARLALGMFAASFDAYPLTFSYAGIAESPDGQAHVIDAKGEGDFQCRWFVDAKTHLPLMLSWSAREPLRMNAGPGGATIGDSAGRVAGGAGSGGGAMTADQRDRMMRDLDARIREADARRRVVEYRMYFGQYKDAGNGVRMPTRIQRSIDGQPVDEVVFERIRLNPRIDPKTFSVSR